MPTPPQSGRCQVEIVAQGGGISFRKSLPVPRQQTLAWAVNASGVWALYPQLKEAKLGVWGKVLPPTTVVQDGDRIEVYTPIDPDAVKKHRANLPKRDKSAKVAADD